MFCFRARAANDSRNIIQPKHCLERHRLVILCLIGSFQNKWTPKGPCVKSKPVRSIYYESIWLDSYLEVDELTLQGFMCTIHSQTLANENR